MTHQAVGPSRTYSPRKTSTHFRQNTNTSSPAWSDAFSLGRVSDSTATLETFPGNRVPPRDYFGRESDPSSHRLLGTEVEESLRSRGAFRSEDERIRTCRVRGRGRRTSARPRPVPPVLGSRNGRLAVAARLRPSGYASCHVHEDRGLGRGTKGEGMAGRGLSHVGCPSGVIRCLEARRNRTKVRCGTNKKRMKKKKRKKGCKTLDNRHFRAGFPEADGA